MPAPPPAPVRQPVPFRAVAFARPLADPAGGWRPYPGQLPGDIPLRPDAAYRLAFPADGTTDATIAKLRALKDWPNLEAVDLSGCGQVTDAALGHLGAVPGSGPSGSRTPR